MKKVSVLLFSVLLGMLTMSPAFGASKKKAPPRINQSPTITAVTANSITIRDQAVTKTLTITQFSEINVNGRRAAVADLRPGMTVSFVLGTDPNKASRINATGR
jgi:hypothetical protein